jgi:phosphonate transport system substrate-binding protein
MGEVTESTAGSSSQQVQPNRSASGLRILFWGCVLVVVGVVIKSYLEYRSASADVQVVQASTVRSTGLVQVADRHLAPQFTDAQNRLLADPPASPDQLQDPQTIVLGRWESTDAETPSIPWDQFEKHLSTAIGRKVQDLKFDNSPAQIAQIKTGAITLVALHAADAPFLVNNAGYQPIAVLADQDTGVSGNHLDIIVPAKSPITRPADLRGHTMVCVVPSSVTGYRAAITLLLKNENLRPNVDYTLIWSLKQKASILGIAQNQYEAAAISDDKLQSMLKAGDIKSSDYRVIYQSEVIPRMTIGWFYNLKPELSQKIRDAIISFRPGSSVAVATDAENASDIPSQSLHFVPVDYKKDFELVRLIDDSFDPRLDSKATK